MLTVARPWQGAVESNLDMLLTCNQSHCVVIVRDLNLPLKPQWTTSTVPCFTGEWFTPTPMSRSTLQHLAHHQRCLSTLARQKHNNDPQSPVIDKKSHALKLAPTGSQLEILKQPGPYQRRLVPTIARALDRERPRWRRRRRRRRRLETRIHQVRRKPFRRHRHITPQPVIPLPPRLAGVFAEECDAV